jgi:hypothetical protein
VGWFIISIGGNFALLELPPSVDFSPFPGVCVVVSIHLVSVVIPVRTAVFGLVKSLPFAVSILSSMIVLGFSAGCSPSS